MSGYRPIYKRIWKDPDFQEMSAIDKLVFLYLCTNEMTTESGIYHLTIKTVSDETCVDITTVGELFNNGLTRVGQGLGKGCFKNVIYDPENKLIFVKKLRKYNTGGRPELVAKSIKMDYDSCPKSSLWEEFIKEYPEYQGLLNGCLTVVQPSDTVTIQYSNDIDSKGVRGEEVSNILGKVFDNYQNNIGQLTPIISDQIQDAITTYTVQWVKDAIAEATKREKRSWAYIEGILRGWQREGRGSKKVSGSDIRSRYKRVN